MDQLMKILLSLTMMYFMRDIFRYQPVWVRIWLVVVISALFIAPMFFLEHVAAQSMVGMFIFGGMIMSLMHQKMGMTKLMGVGHLPWLIPLYFIFTDLSMPVASQNYYIWLVTAAVLAVVCLAIDIVDVVQYVSGKNREQVAPPAPV
jgi:Kef-type K+ transport system membrane component KefB